MFHVMLTELASTLLSAPPFWYGLMIALPFTPWGARLLFGLDGGGRGGGGSDGPATILYYRVLKHAVNPYHDDVYHVTLWDGDKKWVQQSIGGHGDEVGKAALGEAVARAARAAAARAGGGPLFLATYDTAYQEAAMRYLLAPYVELDAQVAFVDLRMAYLFVHAERKNARLEEMCAGLFEEDVGEGEGEGSAGEEEGEGEGEGGGGEIVARRQRQRQRPSRMRQYKYVLSHVLDEAELGGSAAEMLALVGAMRNPRGE
jgi:hypothetical protein